MGDRKKVLIAEDDVALLRALSERVRAAGYDVLSVQDGYQALEFCRKHQPDVVLLDVNMPAGTGLSVHARLRSAEDLASIPVIYLTGDARESVVYRAHELGALAVLHKPINTRELLKALESVLEHEKNVKDTA